MTSAIDWPVRLPAQASALADVSWEQLATWYGELAGVELSAGNVEPWLAAWSHLESLIGEAASRAMIAYTCQTGDAALEAAHLRFSSEILPRVEEQSVALARRLVDSGLQVSGLETTIRRFRTGIELFREANVALFARLEAEAATYQRITGAMTAEWEGRTLPLPMLQPFLLDPDRTVREAAFRRMARPYVAERDALSGLFDRTYALRQQVAANAGFPSYREYAFRAKCRFDYGVEDCERFHDAVEETVVPAIGRMMEARRARLGVETVRPWDVAVSPYRAEPLRPFQDATELGTIGVRVFGRVAPVFGDWFSTMIAENMVDLDSRGGKAPGGYCDTLHVVGRPFIFMNASGILDDVMTLLHEGGHAFHAFAAHTQPYVWQRHPGAEAAELASMSMELLAAPWLEEPVGPLDAADTGLARLEKLEDVLLGLAHIAAVDAFQHWLYASGEGHDAEARDRAWLRLRARFEPHVDWSGLQPERVARWYRQLHIFLHPFYYIEYGLAQLGALQVWRNSLRNPEGAVHAYREFLALGATRPLPDLYRTAGAALVFDANGMRPLVALVEHELVALRDRAGAGREVAKGQSPP